MKKSALLSILTGSLLLSGWGCGGSESPPVADPTTKIRMAQAELVGFKKDGADVWLGIPFATPPTGELRWQPPLAPHPWQGLRTALEHGSPCLQLEFNGEVSGEEDCLTLNVYAPSDRKADEPLPVMYFIHGGGNSIGDATVYDASRLASENRVVVVTIHYRLGVMGWFTHSALREVAANPEAASGNFATLDMIRGLEWVRDHISAFGGDPENVTIFGESAGGINVFSLLLSPPAKGLFHRAISESGILATIGMPEAEAATDDPEVEGLPGSSTEVLLTLLQQGGEAADRDAAKQQLAAMSPDEIRTYLYGFSGKELIESFAKDGGALGGMYFAPFVFRDGHVILDEDPLEAFAAGHHNQVPTILGTNRDENRLFSAFGSPYVSHLGGLPWRLKDKERYQLEAEFGSKLWKANGADEPAFAMSKSQRSTVYGYRFDWDEEGSILWLDLADLIGAGHAIELLFVFGGTNSDFAKDYLLDDVESAELLSQQMRSYWAEFAKTGEPGRGQAGELPEWPVWSDAADADKARYMILDSARDQGLTTATETWTAEGVLASVATDERIQSDEERCRIYTGFVQFSTELSPEAYETVAGGVCKAFPLESRTPGG